MCIWWSDLGHHYHGFLLLLLLLLCSSLHLLYASNLLFFVLLSLYVSRIVIILSTHPLPSLSLLNHPSPPLRYSPLHLSPDPPYPPPTSIFLPLLSNPLLLPLLLCLSLFSVQLSDTARSSGLLREIIFPRLDRYYILFFNQRRKAKT